MRRRAGDHLGAGVGQPAGRERLPRRRRGAATCRGQRTDDGTGPIGAPGQPAAWARRERRRQVGVVRGLCLRGLCGCVCSRRGSASSVRRPGDLRCPLPSHARSLQMPSGPRVRWRPRRQRKFDAMYHRAFAGQSQWAEQRRPMDDLFLAYAEDIGLDLVQFDRDFRAASTARRVADDVADARALTVSSSPTFFVAGTRSEPRNYQDLTDALDAALRAR